MNERTLRDRFHALGPLVLRVGIALILLCDGLQRPAGMFQQDAATGVQTETGALTKAVATMTPDGIRFNADWVTLLRVGEVVAAGLLLVGLATRLVVLPVLAVLEASTTVKVPFSPMRTCSPTTLVRPKRLRANTVLRIVTLASVFGSAG